MNVLARIQIVSLMLSMMVLSRLTLADNSTVGRCNAYSNKLPYKNFPCTLKYMCIFSETGFMVFLSDLVHNSVSLEGLSVKIVAVGGNYQMFRVEFQGAS
jgi:hypothetical protein